MTNGAKPTVPYWHVWTDAQGVSRQTRCEMTAFTLESIAPPASPQWLGAATEALANVFVTVLPPGWVGDWHENPRPQWIIPLSGRWFVETMDGLRVEMGPGEMSFGEDQDTHAADGRRGHLSGAVGSEPCVLMMVQLAEGPKPASPCRFV